MSLKVLDGMNVPSGMTVDVYEKHLDKYESIHHKSLYSSNMKLHILGIGVGMVSLVESILKRFGADQTTTDVYEKNTTIVPANSPSVAKANSTAKDTLAINKKES